MQSLYLLVGIICGVLIWSEFGRLLGQDQFSSMIVLIALSYCYAGFTALGLNGRVNLKEYQANTLVFFFGVGLITLQWIIFWISEGQIYSILFYAALLLSLFLGLLRLTSLKYGLIENTFPPSEEIKRDVEEKYIADRPTPPSIPTTKKIFDMVLAWVGFILSSPLWIIISLLILLQDPGPIFFIKNSVGYRGKTFRLLKFRTMKKDAEEEIGPIASRNPDDRIHRLGHFLRVTALDELPQLLNIIRGEMSFVGPRPLRTMVEIEYLKEIPGYAARYDILPGISGLAQIAGDYYLPSRDKLRYERIYADNLSLRFDIKLIFLAFVLVFWLRWKKGWDGKVPRGWIKWKGLGSRY